MAHAITQQDIRLGTPSNYRIRVQGEMSENRSDRLGNMIITGAFSEAGYPVSILVGRMEEQKTLINVLNTLHEMHMPLLSLEKLDGVRFMSGPHRKRMVKFGNRTIYRIDAQGELENIRNDLLMGMRITRIDNSGESPVATLFGRIRDQAQLSGVLNSLHELHLAILSVALWEDEQTANLKHL